MEMVVNFANSILRLNYVLGPDDPDGLTFPRVSNFWIGRFWERHPYRKKEKAQERFRINAFPSVEHLLDWYQRYKAKKAELGIANLDTNNVNKTKFQTREGRDQYIITKNAGHDHSTNTETNWTTVNLKSLATTTLYLVKLILPAPYTS